jgi:hypothetical protein
VVQAAALLGIGRSNAYHAVKTQTWPTRVVRVGWCIRIPAADVLRLLGIETSGETHERICVQALPVQRDGRREAAENL